MKRNRLFIKRCTQVILLLTTLFFVKQSIGQTVVVTNPVSPWTVPAGVTSVKVEVWGGGGGGGGCQGTGFSGTNVGSGGGGGAYNVMTLSVIPGQSYTISIGAGGSVGDDANGGSGGNTTVTGSAGTVTATGGAGGVRRGGAAGGGGSGFNNGGNGGVGTSNGAGGGGGAGNKTPTLTGNGGAGTNSAAGGGGTGTITGGAGGAAQTGSDNSGNSGIVPGGGGGGGRSSGFLKGANSGGRGAVGQVVLTYTVCTPPSAPAVATPVNYCKNTTAFALTATGSNLLWYTLPSGGTGSSTAPTPSTATVGTTNYYVSQTIGCEGSRANIQVIVNPLPVATVTGKTNINCFAGSDGTITISGSGTTGPYTFSIDNGSTFQSETGTNLHEFIGLQANTPYTIKVKDANGCISN